MTLTEAVILTKKLISNYPELKGWTVTSNRRKKAAGVCRYGTRQIELSAYLTGLMTDDAVNDTIIHEIAHALTPGHHHDYVWKSKCLELGGNGKRCFNDESYKDAKQVESVMEKNTKYTLTCPCCGYKIFKSRKPIRSHSCGKHGFRTYQAEFKMIVTQNY